MSLKWTPRTRRVALVLFAAVVALLLYAGTPAPVPSPGGAAVGDVAAQNRFTWTYAELVIDEGLLLLVLGLVVAPFVARRLSSVFEREVHLRRAFRWVALAVTLIGVSLFAFWVIIDLLGGYNGPSYTFAHYPLVKSIYDGLGFDRLALPGEAGRIGFGALSLATVAVIALLADRGLGAAIKNGVAFFAAPITMFFELLLWGYIPADMYWHVTTFVPWSIGAYLSNEQFEYMTSSGDFIWGGNIFAVSNWFVLVASLLVIVVGVVTIGKESQKRIRRQRHRR